MVSLSLSLPLSTACACVCVPCLSSPEPPYGTGLDQGLGRWRHAHVGTRRRAHLPCGHVTIGLPMRIKRRENCFEKSRRSAEAKLRASLCDQCTPLSRSLTHEFRWSTASQRRTRASTSASSSIRLRTSSRVFCVMRRTLTCGCAATASQNGTRWPYIGAVIAPTTRTDGVASSRSTAARKADEWSSILPISSRMTRARARPRLGTRGLEVRAPRSFRR